MSKSILIAGASGALGFKLLKDFKSRGFKIRALTHSEEGLEKLKGEVDDIHYLDASEDKGKLEGITRDMDYVVSALGKSISLFHPDPDTFYESNYKANSHLLEDAKKYRVKKFIYVSMMGADSAYEYKIPGTHRKTEKDIQNSGLNYSIIRPVGFYSGLHDLIIMAKKKVIPLVGDGKAKTNSIFHGDLANFISDNFTGLPEILEIGGPKIHTREEMAVMIQEKIGGKIIKVPESIAKSGSEVPKLFAKENLGHKLDYFSYIMSNDMIGQSRGSLTFKDYLNQIDLENID
jgi:nucleoside-diphosphate-sugar epimerase